MIGSNPVLSERTYNGLPRTSGEVMTLDGTVNKSGILLLTTILTAAFSWNLISTNPALGGGVAVLGLIVGALCAIALCFKQSWAPVLAPVYAVFEGALLGAISSVFNAKYQGIAFQAAALTLGVLGVMLVLYRTGVLRATQKFMVVVMAATGAITLVYLVSMVMGLFGKSIPMIHESGPIGIGFSVVVVAVAALNLILDFGIIESGVQRGAPKYMEWYAGFSLLVTLVWLYLEILRLLSKLNNARR
jgi:uncharacterized YccA/Bax inhibitor family protein